MQRDLLLDVSFGDRISCIDRVVMKMGRPSKACKAKSDADEVIPTEIHYSALSLFDLPRYILVDILLRTPIKWVVSCKCTCKTLYDIISDPEFTKLHFAHQDVCLVIRKFYTSHISRIYTSRISRILYLLQLEHDKDFIGRFSCDKCRDFNPRCGCHFDIRLDIKLKLPLRNLQLALNLNDGNNGELTSEFEADRNQGIRLKPKDHKYELVNSCNGLLCLSEPDDNNPVAVCNPVTGEFINLPEATKFDESHYLKNLKDCGLGFSSVGNQYKVVRIFGKFVRHDRLAEVHTLGTRSWRSIGTAPRSTYKMAFPTYLNGALHWFCLDPQKSDIIVSFDMDKEDFQSFPSPFTSPWTLQQYRLNNKHMNMSMGVLEGCLFVCESFSSSKIHVWMMKEYGVRNSWTKAYSIDGENDRLPRGIYLPIKHLSNRALLLFQYSDGALICYKGNEERIRYFKINGFQSSFEAFAHTPSFVSLKDVVAGDNVEVLSFWSRFSDVKLPGEVRAISFREKMWDQETYSDKTYDRQRLEDHLWQ